MTDTNSRPANVSLSRKTQRQIMLVFLLSVIASSIMIFFYVSGRTAELLEKEQAKQESESTAPVDSLPTELPGE